MNRDYYWPAYLIAMSVMLWLWIDQMETDRVIEAGTLDAVVAPAEAYFGPRDTSVIRWVCCRVVR